MVLKKIYLCIFCHKISIYSVFAQRELVKTRIIHPEIFCPPKSATRKVFAFPASGVQYSTEYSTVQYSPQHLAPPAPVSRYITWLAAAAPHLQVLHLGSSTQVRDSTFLELIDRGLLSHLEELQVATLCTVYTNLQCILSVLCTVYLYTTCTGSVNCILSVHCACRLYILLPVSGREVRAPDPDNPGLPHRLVPGQGGQGDAGGQSGKT